MLMLPSRVRLRSNVLRRERSALLAKGSRAVPVQAIFRGYIARRDDRLLGVSSVAVAGVGVGVVVVGVGVGVGVGIGIGVGVGVNVVAAAAVVAVVGAVVDAVTLNHRKKLVSSP